MEFLGVKTKKGRLITPDQLPSRNVDEPGAVEVLPAAHDQAPELVGADSPPTSDIAVSSGAQQTPAAAVQLQPVEAASSTSADFPPHNE